MNVRVLQLVLLNVFFPLLLLSQAAAAQPVATKLQTWVRLELKEISAISPEVVSQALQKAKDVSAAGLLIQLDSPGGSLDPTRKICQEILNSPLPVVTWVGPQGAHAGSAGAFIGMSSHVLAMSPSTNIGAAKPVSSTGENLSSSSDLNQKIENDAIALMQSMAQTRSRNQEMAASMVANSLSLSSQQALDERVIDLISPNLDSLMQEIHGRRIKLQEEETLLVSDKIQWLDYQRSFRQSLLEILGHPEIFYLLLVAGLLCLAFEVTHPGLILPGVVGTICLFLALTASQILPVNLGAMLLVVASLAFMVAEIFVPSFGALGIGGLIGFVTGSILLFDSHQHPDSALSLWLILPITAILLLGLLALARLLLKNLRQKPQTGVETLLGKQVEAVEYFIDGKGRVRLAGEYWNAQEINHATIKPGDILIIEAISGLDLTVKLIYALEKES